MMTIVFDNLRIITDLQALRLRLGGTDFTVDFEYFAIGIKSVAVVIGDMRVSMSIYAVNSVIFPCG